MNKILFVTFYTVETIYEKSFKEKLLPSLNKFNLPYWAKPIQNLGNWEQNTIQKPPTIFEALNKYFEDIVWTDADSVINEYPELFFRIPREYDIGVHYLSWEKFFGRTSDKNKFSLLDGTIFIRNSEKMKKFIEQWKQNSTDKNINHQQILEDMLEQNKNIKVLDIGLAYSYILTRPNGNPPAQILKNPVIVHYQLSREGRKCLNIITH